MISQLEEEYGPVAAIECIVVQRIAGYLWRLRALSLEREVLDEHPISDLNHSVRYESHLDRGLERAEQRLERRQADQRSRELESRGIPVQADGVPEGK